MANLLSTGEAIHALGVAGDRMDASAAVGQGTDWLASVQGGARNESCQKGDPRLDGSWSLGRNALDIPTVYGVLALGCYGAPNVSRHASVRSLRALPTKTAAQICASASPWPTLATW